MECPDTPMVFSFEQRIVHHLLLNSNSIKDNGLLYGKMGIAISLLSYGKLVDNEVYMDAGGDLLDEVLNNINNSMTIYFASGLCGIGWGVEFLIQNKMVDGCSNEVCRNIDKEIMSKDIRRLTDLSLDTGLEGMLHYILFHISGSVKQQMDIPFDEMYLQEVYSVVKLIDMQNCTPDMWEKRQEYINYIENGVLPKTQINIKFCIDNMNLDEKRLSTYPLSLKTGIAGYLINQMKSNKRNDI